MKLLRVTALGLALMLPAVSLAQWQWIDNAGRKVFSDQPPPTDVPAKRIIRQPGAKAPSSDEPQAAAPAPLPAPKPSGKDRQLEERKKQAEAAEAEKKKVHDEQLAKMRADNCERARRAKATLDSGMRLSQVNAKGEREVLDDATRAAETRRLDGVIASDCRPAGAQ
jgi:hypothetical protein